MQRSISDERARKTALIQALAAKRTAKLQQDAFSQAVSQALPESDSDTEQDRELQDWDSSPENKPPAADNKLKQFSRLKRLEDAKKPSSTAPADEGIDSLLQKLSLNKQPTANPPPPRQPLHESISKLSDSNDSGPEGEEEGNLSDSSSGSDGPDLSFLRERSSDEGSKPQPSNEDESYEALVLGDKKEYVLEGKLHKKLYPHQVLMQGTSNGMPQFKFHVQ